MMTREQAIDELWQVLEDPHNCLLFSDIGKAVRFLEYFNEDQDYHFMGKEAMGFVNSWEGEHTYWNRNGTFALLVLAAEGEL